MEGLHTAAASEAPRLISALNAPKLIAAEPFETEEVVAVAEEGVEVAEEAVLEVAEAEAEAEAEAAAATTAKADGTAPSVWVRNSGTPPPPALVTAAPAASDCVLGRLILVMRCNTAKELSSKEEVCRSDVMVLCDLLLPSAEGGSGVLPLEEEEEEKEEAEEEDRVVGESKASREFCCSSSISLRSCACAITIWARSRLRCSNESSACGGAVVVVVDPFCSSLLLATVEV